MASKTMRTNKHENTFNLASFNRMPSLDQQFERYNALTDSIRKLEAEARKDPKAKKALEAKRFELEEFIGSPYCGALRSVLAERAEAKRKASLKRQAEAIVAKRRNEEPLQLLRKQQAAKRAKDQEVQKALRKAKLPQPVAKPIEKKPSEVETLVAELQKALGGYAF